MTKSTFLTTAIAALFLITLGVNSGVAAKDNGKSKGMGSQIEQNSGTHAGDHSNIKSGRDFGQHVREHNDHFSGDHNPGKHHKVYSGIKNK